MSTHVDIDFCFLLPFHVKFELRFSDDLNLALKVKNFSWNCWIYNVYYTNYPTYWTFVPCAIFKISDQNFWCALEIFFVSIEMKDNYHLYSNCCAYINLLKNIICWIKWLTMPFKVTVPMKKYTNLRKLIDSIRIHFQLTNILRKIQWYF